MNKLICLSSVVIILAGCTSKKSEFASIKEKGLIKVAVIDDGFSSQFKDKVPLCEGSEVGKSDIGHGDNVVGLIVAHAPKDGYCIKTYKAFQLENGGFDSERYVPSLEQALKDKVDIINISAGGTPFSKEEASVIQQILDAGITVIAAAGNNSHNLGENCNYYPACLDNRIIVVGNAGMFGRNPGSNYGPQVDVTEDGANVTGLGVTLSGTSQATAIHTGKHLAKILKK